MIACLDEDILGWHDIYEEWHSSIAYRYLWVLISKDYTHEEWHTYVAYIYLWVMISEDNVLEEWHTSIAHR